MSNVDMRVTLAGMTMKNPVVVASGTFGFGREYSQFFDLSELGGICAKGLTLLPREGNCKTPEWTPSSPKNCPFCGSMM